MRKFLSGILLAVGLLVFSPSLTGECKEIATPVVDSLDGVYYEGSYIPTVKESYKGVDIYYTSPVKAQTIKSCIDLMPLKILNELQGKNIVEVNCERLLSVYFVEDNIMYCDEHVDLSNLFEPYELIGLTWENTILLSSIIEDNAFARTVLHEFGHIADQNKTYSSLVVNDDYYKVVGELTKGYRDHMVSQPHEAFAESFGLFFTNNLDLYQRSPEVYNTILAVIS